MQRGLVRTSHLNDFEDAVVKVGETRVLVHHAVDELAELEQEGFTGREAIALQRLHQRYHVGDYLSHQEINIHYYS